MNNDDNEGQSPKKVTDVEAVKDNTRMAVQMFNERWAPAPTFYIGVEVMDVRQLRDAMGLRATIDVGDPWPTAEKLLIDMGFQWHWLGSTRVMFLRERDEFIQYEDEGWYDGEEVEEE